MSFVKVSGRNKRFRSNKHQAKYFRKLKLGRETPAGFWRQGETEKPSPVTVLYPLDYK